MATAGNSTVAENISEEEHMHSWHYSYNEVENNSPSRKDGISRNREGELRKYYCLFIREVGSRLGLPMVTTATAMMFCHRFYLRQSHAKNAWQTIATVSIFLASKAEDTPVPLDRMVRVAYETFHQSDPSNARKIYQKQDEFAKQKELILTAEILLLVTLRFNLDIEHPYKPLVDAMKRLGIVQRDVRQTACKIVNDCLQTSLCLQHKPHYVAASALYFSAKLHNIKLPIERDNVWWYQFNVAPKPLEAAIKQMAYLGCQRPPAAKPAESFSAPKASSEKLSDSPASVLSKPDLAQGSTSADVSCGEGDDDSLPLELSGQNSRADDRRSSVAESARPAASSGRNLGDSDTRLDAARKRKWAER